MLPAAAAPEPVAGDVAARVVEFARACKTAARAVSLYPPTHPAIGMSLDRLVEASTRATEGGALQLTVMPGVLLVEGRPIARPDAALGDLAALLHQHLVGAMRLAGGGDGEAWRSFLGILARAPEDVRAQGGIARVWAATAARHLELTELDYSEVLRERTRGADATWDQIVAHCLQGESVELSEETLRLLVEIAGDSDRLNQLGDLLTERAAASGTRGHVSALLRMFGSIIEAVSGREADRLDATLRNMAGTVSRLTPDALLELLARQPDSSGSTVNLVGEIVARINDAHVSSFVARSVLSERGASARLAEAFQALVPGHERKHRLLQVAHDQLAPTPFGQEADFSSLWQNAKEMLTSYSDESFVGHDYARELSVARTQAIEVERVSDDPPARIAQWLAGVSDAALRELDLQLLLDLMVVERDVQRWRELTAPVLQHVQDLLLIGDFEAAGRLVQALVAEAAAGREHPTSEIAATALQRLVAGPMMRHVATHLQTIDDLAFEHVKRLVAALGPVLVPSLAETLSGEDRARPRQRLTDLLLGFGKAGRQSVEQLRNSANPAVRRTAIHLLREFAGEDALPDLALLLDDHEPHVQREAIRAILAIGTDESYAVLERALASGTEGSRGAIMEMLSSMRDERAAPLFAYIVTHVDPRGSLRSVYVHAIESLGALRDRSSVSILRDALHRGEWYAPMRTAALRKTVAAALRRIGTPDALDALREAATNGRRGVRAVARAELVRTAGGAP